VVPFAVVIRRNVSVPTAQHSARLMNNIVAQVAWIKREVRRQTYAMVVLIGMDLR
jgi:hypothetical protein